MDKNAQSKRDFNLGNWERYDYDLDAGTLAWSHQGLPKVIGRVQVVGTTSNRTNNWLWAWANSHWPEHVVAAAQQAKAYGEKHGICELTHDYIEQSDMEDDDLNALGWELAAVTARIANAQGAYRPTPDERGALFLVYFDLAFAS